MDNIQVTLFGYIMGCGWVDARILWGTFGDEVVTFLTPDEGPGEDDIVLNTVTLDSIVDWVKAEAITRNVSGKVQIILDE